MDNSVTKFVRADLNISESITIDCYLMPNGEKRIGITGAALAAGRSKEYLSRMLNSQVAKTSSKTLKSLQDMGFTGCQIEGSVLRNGVRGSSITKTISARDFAKYITWESIKNQQKEAIVLLGAFAETGIDHTLDLLFRGKSVEFLLEKIVHYSKWTNEDLMQALACNWDDVALIEEQERFLGGMG